MKRYPGIRWVVAAVLCAALLAGCGRGGVLIGHEIDAPDPAPDAEADPAPDSDADAAQDTLDPAGDPDVPHEGDDSVDAPSDVTDLDAEPPEVYLCPDVTIA